MINENNTAAASSSKVKLSLGIRLYPYLKSFIPKNFRLLVRRKHVRRILDKCNGTWPIDESAIKPPVGWQGWPEGKTFAFIITHDVETAEGLDKCNVLSEIDMQYGFRSSFGFVPGDYHVPPELRQNLLKHGFEIVLHGLNHKKNIFRSKKTFMRQVPIINQFLKDWQAVGFRAPSMYHNLTWIHHLEIEYDASTFDTDPFEPQPDGVATIFPIWCQDGAEHKGYVELPYTLPQDYLLFILMKEKTIDIWKEKLDWIAKNNGMALLITHPDYINPERGRCGLQEYPLQLYEDFLHYLKRTYEGQYWNPLPKEISRFWKEKTVCLKPC
jgi:peptidoglycan/xylan/chitin deacetylase (PgdA/CDA1 family)